jgi:LAGLIDADG-like domain
MQPHVYPRKGNSGSLAYHFNSTEKVGNLYDRLGWQPCVAIGKKLGRYIRGLNQEGIAAVLRGYFDCECSISAVGSIEVASASWTLLHEVKVALLLHFGIIGNLKPLKNAEYPDNDYWVLHLYGGEAESYVRQIGFRSEIRQERAKVCLGLGKMRNPNIDVIPNLGHFLTAIHEASETTREHVTLVRDYKGAEPRAEVTYQRLGLILSAKWSEGPALERLREIHAANYYYDVVTKVEMLDSEPISVIGTWKPCTHDRRIGSSLPPNSREQNLAAAVLPVSRICTRRRPRQASFIPPKNGTRTESLFVPATSIWPEIQSFAGAGTTCGIVWQAGWFQRGWM